MQAILAIDQGTTSSRAIAFDKNMQPMASAQQEFTQYYPQSGWVEHDVEEIWQSVINTCRQTLDQLSSDTTIAAIGITNQRESTLLWNTDTSAAIYPVIVWQDRRTGEYCQSLKDAGAETNVQNTTGLLLDPYFSATKIHWILHNVPSAKSLAAANKLAFGTLDSYLIWRLTGGKRHVTDATNASRTMLFDINKGCWSQSMCQLFDIPMHILPEVLDCDAEFGITDSQIFGQAIAIRGVAGDQQAATIGQACFQAGMMKSTYGTGCFALLNTGAERVYSSQRMLSTIAYQLNGKITYALEGAIFNAGTVVQWLRDQLKLITEASEINPLAKQADDSQDVILVPAFTGLGAPYWQPESRGAIFGLSRNSGPAELAKAALQSVAFQTQDLLAAMQADCPTLTAHTLLRVDGGMANSDWTMQCISDIIGAQVDRPVNVESTAIGAAWLAGQGAGIYGSQKEFSQQWQCQQSFMPVMDKDQALQQYQRWQKAIQSTIAFS